MKKIVCIAVFLIIPAFLSFSQNEETELAGELYTRTILLDIETSGFHELSDWCGRIGLAQDGSANELRKRLYNFYNVSPEAASNESAAKQQITIEKAENLKYFTIEKVDENYAKITGDVYIKLVDKEKNETHIIYADTILFNFKENYLTATGNIRYQLEGETKTENFRGEKLTFNIDNSEGLFDKGVTEQEKTVGDEDIIFYFKGDLINKTKENYVVLENGEITSCDFEDSHYTIKATKIWLLTSNEWAILNGIVYIGRVPLFYFPAFLYGGDDLFFNPVFGMRNDFGNYLQTTTYFIGEKKEDEDTAFSFMQTDQKNNYYKREGLYLTEDKNPSADTKALQDYGRGSKNYIKLLLDYYTNLGLYGALELKLTTPSGDEKNVFPEFLNSIFSVVKNTELYLSAAKTRYLENTGLLYSALFLDDSAVYSSIWQDSYFYKTRIPIRYGIDYATIMDLDWLKLNLDFSMYSDSEYTEDFFDRSENLDFLSFMDQSTDSAAGGSETLAYNWIADLSIKPSTAAVKPWINSLSLSAKTQLGWKSKAYADEDSSYETVKDFFYPDNFEQLIASITLGGQILPFNNNNASENSAEKPDIELELRAPWEDESNESEKNTINENIPDAVPDAEINISDYWTDNDAFKNKLTYSLTPKYSNRSQLSSGEWSTPDDISISDIDYSYLNAAVDSKLSYSANIFGELFDFNNYTNISWDYKKHYEMDKLTEETINNYIDEDKQASDAKVTNNLTIDIMPFVYLDYFEKSKITYDFNSLLYEWDYSTENKEFISEIFKLDEEYIKSHKISLSLPMQIRNLSQTVNISTTLPPVSMKTSGSLILKYWISTSEFNTDISETDDGWDFSPLTFNEKLDFGNSNTITNNISFNYSDLLFEKNITKVIFSFLDSNITASTDLTYDFTENVMESLTVNLNLYFFTAGFTAKNTYDYNFDLLSGWVQDNEQSFISESMNFSINHNSDDLKFWKNRVNLSYNIGSILNMKLIRFTESNFSLKVGFALKIYKFMELTFESSSINSSIFRYIQSYTDETGINKVNGFEDLFKSFNFFNVEDRYESNFNLQNLKIGLKHDLHDWDLNITYSGKPYVNKEGDYPVYDWENSLDISLKWKAIPDAKSEVKIDNQGVSF